MRCHRHLVIAMFDTVTSPGRHLARVSGPLLVTHCRHHLDDEVDQITRDRDDRVRYNITFFRVRQLEAQPSIDDAKNQENTSPPEMDIAENAATASLHKVLVVQLAQSRLNREQAHHDRAEQSMVVVKELKS